VPFQVLNAPEQQQIGEILKEQLAPLGINLDIQTVTDAQNRQSAQEHAFTSSWSQWQGRSDPDAFLYPTLHSGDPLNWTSYSNPDVDTWLEQARTSSNRDQRKTLYSQVIRQVVDDAPEFVLAFVPYLSASSKQVQGVVLRPIPLPYFDGVWLTQ
jgi:peptide/nickel transport system substrate-binding protein